MRYLLLLPWILIGLSGCASQPPLPSWHSLLADEAFPTVDNGPSPAEVFALNSQVTQELSQKLRSDQRTQGSRFQAHRWLANELDSSQGHFSYNGNLTQTAAQTYSNRQGNCMSLVILASSMAKVLSIPVSYQVVEVLPHWDRQGQFYLINGHINVRLHPPRDANVVNFSRGVVLDFLPERSIRRYREYDVSEATALAMFYNNLAAEALIDGQTANAYGLIKQSLRHDPHLSMAVNTLALIYRQKGLDTQAEKAYRYGIRLEPDDMSVLHNLSILLASQGRLEEWAQVHKKIELARIANPFYYYDMGEIAFAEGRYNAAIDWYQKALAKADYRPEFYHGLAKSYHSQGKAGLAQKFLQKALALSADEKQRHLYQGKLLSLANIAS
ncbi:tetratricopeptide repeat protein [Shewanella sp. NIFS-20-20]|uniref:tetratricopeptide repeat protein n=1 Tax=Shewanella sp. NIFS-20-20 TaxID=2853806 RepID=UPI001C4609E1|nr:tetratricopeptide repeat protein [Shewanella sp. NIFS-20-20]MBV7314658.1 tetratricopeptide repeat protein [Shewanella sp. NIFS-20-20]